MTLDLVLYIVSAVCFAIAAFGDSRFGQFNLVAAGLFFWVITHII